MTAAAVGKDLRDAFPGRGDRVKTGERTWWKILHKFIVQ
jgi:hypothetical protein